MAGDLFEIELDAVPAEGLCVTAAAVQAPDVTSLEDVAIIQDRGAERLELNFAIPGTVQGVESTKWVGTPMLLMSTAVLTSRSSAETAVAGHEGSSELHCSCAGNSTERRQTPS